MTAPLAYVTVSAETEAIRRGARVRFQPVRDSLAFVVLSALFSSCALALWNAFATQAFNNLALRPGMKRLLAGAFFFRHQPCIDRLIFLSVPHCRSRLAAGILGQHRESADPAVQRTGSSDPRIAYPLPGLTSTVLCETERSTSSNQPDFAGFESVIGQSGCIANLGPFL
jgi:hypothetical protein